MCRQFWVIIGAVFFTELCLASYIDNLNDTLVKRFQISYVNAGYFLFIPYGAAAFLSYLIGKVLSKNPKFKRKIILFVVILFSIGIIAVYLMPNVNS